MVGLFILGCNAVNGADVEVSKVVPETQESATKTSSAVGGVAWADSEIPNTVKNALPAGFTEYVPTGDELWDRYAQALLEQIGWQVLDFENQPTSIFNSVLPQETILEWEDDFGDDPRYWQLCYVNADRLTPDEYGNGAKIKGYTYSGPEPMTYLERAMEMGVTDNATFFLLAYARLGEWDVQPGEYSEERVLDWLVEQCPDESEAYYRRAEYWLKSGDWDKGLADLEAGNVAKNNRILMPFPFSFVVDAAKNKTLVGNDIAAGAVSGDLMFPYVLGNIIEVKRNLRSQFERLIQGHSTDELVPWVAFSCRYGSVENGKTLRWYAGSMYLGMIAENLLVDNGDQLSRDQRAALLLLAKRAARIGAYLHYERKLDSMGSERFSGKRDRLAEKYGLTQAELYSDEMDRDDPLMQKLELEIVRLFYEKPWDELQREQTFLYSELVSEYRKILRFDPVAIEWEPRP